MVAATSQIKMVRGGPGSYRLRLNESEIEAEIHTLRDGGLLMQVRALFYWFIYMVYGIYIHNIIQEFNSIDKHKWPLMKFNSQTDESNNLGT